MGKEIKATQLETTYNNLWFLAYSKSIDERLTKIEKDIAELKKKK